MKLSCFFANSCLTRDGLQTLTVSQDHDVYTAQTKLSPDDAASMINGLLWGFAALVLVIFLFRR